ncbi:MAG TPA: ATP-binding cassette domain-containing protein [Bacteroidales bacterium]|nr:ATP-binding cassette domain-containing protein [Bacteroidales bacterium]
MSEEILKALMELFAVVVKQDGGILMSEREYVLRFLNKQLTRESVQEYMALFDQHAGPILESKNESEYSSPSVKDSVKILAICKKINRTLNQEQKIVVLMRLYELINSDRKFSLQRMNIINTVAEVFRISPAEFASIELFIKNDEFSKLNNPAILYLGQENNKVSLVQKMQSGYQDTRIIILRIASVDLYFLKYISPDQIYLNGLPVTAGAIYSFAKGGSIKSSQGHAIYYSDITSCFLSERNVHRISFVTENLNFKFRDDTTAIDNISFATDEGKLIGIMGASGSGKTTLMNIISGILKPTSGSVRINGLDVHENSRELEGVIGLVPQDDLLLEDLTIYENLYYAACQCFKNKPDDQIAKIVNQVLLNLGLHEKKDLKVGSPFNKMISGGQRKRLNIALELIREPSVMFLDEPTSGLSSRDSENLMDLLRDLTLKGKLIFTVIHQPSSEIYKMFDKVLILDKGGCMAFYGNPVDAIIHFKTLDAQINSNIGECPECGNVNPETIFNIIETQVVDEFGKYTEKRKIKPAEWAASFSLKYPFSAPAEVKHKPHSNLQKPGRFEQLKIYLSRDFKGKIANRQYVLLTLLEAPLLGFILSIIIRYIPDPDSDVYIFAENENIPIYIFMSLIVSLFLGLTISAEEIFRDRKILKRERFLNLSRSSYLLSKVTILIFISAIQTFLFVIIANGILEIRGLYINYWLALFTTAFCANMLGLNISAAFNSAITIYIVIPLLIIPMMVLSGAMFPFDKLNRKIGNVEKVPVIAEIMPTRWTYEALIVTQFKDNKYSKVAFDREGDTYYALQKRISEANFNKVHRIPAMRDALKASLMEYGNTVQSDNNNILKKKPEPRYSKLLLLKNELQKISAITGIPEYTYWQGLAPGEFNPSSADSVESYLDKADRLFSLISNNASDQIDRFYNMNGSRLKQLENEYYNYSLKELVTKPYERRKVLYYNNKLVQNTDPVYLDPDLESPMSFRTHFFAPSKYVFGIKTDTFKFNISLVLLSTIALYIILYFDFLGRVVRFFENMSFRKLN